jgi:hypothetical protein
MKSRIFSLISKDDKTVIIRANCPEVALIKAGRMGDLGWSIVDELSIDEYCYTTMKRAISQEYDEMKDILYNIFKSRKEDRLFDAYLYTDEFENITGMRDYEDIVNYVINNY